MQTTLLLLAASPLGLPAFAQAKAVTPITKRQGGSLRVLDDVEFDFGDRTIRYQRIAPPELAPAAAPVAIPVAPPPTAEQLAAWERTARKPQHFVAIAATVFDQRITFLRWSDASTEYRAVSNLDFHHFAGTTTVETADTVFTLFLALESETTAGLTPAQVTARLAEFGVARLPEAAQFPGGASSYPKNVNEVLIRK